MFVTETAIEFERQQWLNTTAADGENASKHVGEVIV
jgi:hypothetical protein